MNEQSLIGRIEIELRIDEDGDVIHTVTAQDADGDPLPLIQSLGALKLAEDSLLNGPDES